MNNTNNISKADKNFDIKSIDKKDIVFYNVCGEPFKVYGLIKPDEKYDFFRRMPPEIADNMNNQGVSDLSRDTAGGRVSFKTDSSYIAIHAFMHYVQLGEHFPATGTAGFDLYEKVDGKETFVKTFIPPFNVRTEKDIVNEYESLIELDGSAEREYVINFPLYSGVKELYIGIQEKAKLKSPGELGVKGRIVYYGSSITQGGCASRPGNTYQAMISRKIDCDYLNLGFSGSARAETQMAEYIAGLDMSAFVFDYDHNAPDVSTLRATHRPFFEIIRKANPKLPVIFVSRPDIQKKYDVDGRFEVIKETYDTAVENGDKNVYLIDGRKIMTEIAGDCGTVDSVHPNDLGFYCMAKSIGKVLEQIIK